MTAVADHTPLDLTLELTDEAATRQLGRALAAKLEPGDVVALWGGLGAGKTSLARAIVTSLNTQETTVPSPTFTLVQTYETPRFTLWHCDFYRLSSQEEVVELGLDEAFARDVTLIEWPDRMGDGLPLQRLDVLLAFGADEQGRTARLKGDAGWAERLSGLADG